jgi:hypothetical protein
MAAASESSCRLLKVLVEHLHCSESSADSEVTELTGDTSQRAIARP